MKRLFIPLLFVAFIGCMFLSCEKADTTPTPVDTKGTANFWASNTMSAVYPINISVNGVYVGSLGARLTSVPGCNDNDRVVKYQNEPGIYNMLAKSANGGSWSGSFTITAGQCNPQELQ